MANILPFQGIRYNPEHVGDLSRVVSPPYDVITEIDQERFYCASPYNVIRLELGKTFSGDDGFRNRYTRAQAFFEKWVSRGILCQDKEPSIYLYEQRFRKGNHAARRLGFIALLKLDDSKKCLVYPHEKTFPSPKEDRSLLLKSLRTNVSPLFFLFPDRKRRIEKMMAAWTRRVSPIADITVGPEVHRMWRLTDPSLIAQLREGVCRSPLFIADGHHRYEVALAFHKKRRSRVGGFVMAYFSNLLDEDLTILPIHRLVRGVKGPFTAVQEKFSDLFTFKSLPSLPRLLEAMEKERRGVVFGMSWKGTLFYLLRLKDRKALSYVDCSCRRHCKAWRRLDVTVLHELILKKKFGFSEKQIRDQVLFNKDLKQCLRHIRQGRYQIGFFLRAPSIHQIRRIALSRERMPQKSTYFYPKPLTGLVMYRFGNEETGSGLYILQNAVST